MATISLKRKAPAIKYWFHPESDSFLEGETHPGDTCEEIDKATYDAGLVRQSQEKAAREWDGAPKGGWGDKTFWNPYRDGVTQGLIAKFMACPERARLALIDGIGPIRTGGALAFGSLFHEALDNIYSYAKDTGHYPSVAGVLAALETRDRERLAEAIGAKADAYTDLEMNFGMAEVLLDQYLGQWNNDLSLYKWQALEQVFGEPGDGCVWHGDDGIPVRIRGKFDGVFRMNGHLWLFETKTKARIEDQGIMDKLGYDLQVMLYMWAIKKVYGEYPMGVVYNLVRRPQLRQGVKENLPQFIGRIRDDVAKRTDFYYLRYNMSITTKEQLAWEIEFDQMMRQLMAWWNGSYHFRNSNSCMSPWTCEFLAICGRNDMTYFQRRESVFPELVMNGEGAEAE